MTAYGAPPSRTVIESHGAFAARPWLARLNPGLFAIAFGVLGLAGTWRRLAALGSGGAAAVADALLVTGLALLALLLALWGAKSWRHASVVRHEWTHPVQGALMALIPLSVLLAIALVAPGLPRWHPTLLGMTLGLLAMQLALAWQVVRRLSSGELPSNLVTPALYLPTVTAGFVGAMALHALGVAGWSALLFGMGLGGWALLEARILHRLFAGPLLPALRPTVGVEMAPPFVGSLAALTLWPQIPAEAVVVALGVASAPVLAVLARWRWWTAVPFSSGFWSFSFPLAALAACVVEATGRGGWPLETAGVAVGLASAAIGYLALRTLILLGRGELLPQP